ncbi:hypothetical protein ACIA5G_45055 [Amycolatopsis sp. NPDC051758]|uniref:hypothetical protein n=1 Tax=Amycolatopsis sp. NPDC051758 TaxID=3363935 RepID=UPI00378E2391
MTGLGAYVERFETNNRRRAGRAVAALAIGTPVAAVGVALVVLADQGGTLGPAMMFPGMIIGAGLGLALLGVTLACQTITRRGETFTLYEAGFVHTKAKTSTEVPWTAIETVVDHTKQNVLAKAFGGDVGCLVRLTGGRKVVVNGFTDGADLLTLRIFEATAPRTSPS